MKELITLVNLITKGGEIAYNDEAKTKLNRLGVSTLKKLAKKLKLREFVASYNRSGIACAGDLSLIGMFNDTVGIYIHLTKSGFSRNDNGFDCYYRTVKHMKDYSGGANNWMNEETFRDFNKLKDCIYSLCKVNESELTGAKQKDRVVSIAKINKAETIEDLEQLGFGGVSCDISYRGGTLGLYGSNVAKVLNIDQTLLPHKVGAYCNYGGGGIRCTVQGTKGFPELIAESKRKKLTALVDACIRAYENVELESGMNEEEVDGETNWDAMGTNAVRRAGITSNM